MTPVERNLLLAVAGVLADVDIKLRGTTRKELMDAMAAAIKEDQVCGAVGYPDRIERTCELERNHACQYHQQGTVRWIVVNFVEYHPVRPPS